MELLRPSPQQLKYDLEFSTSPFLPSPGLGSAAEEFHRKIIKCRGAKSQNYLQKVNIFTTMHPHPTSSCVTDDVGEEYIRGCIYLLLSSEHHTITAIGNPTFVTHAKDNAQRNRKQQNTFVKCRD